MNEYFLDFEPEGPDDFTPEKPDKKTPEPILQPINPNPESFIPYYSPDDVMPDSDDDDENIEKEAM